MLMKGVTLKSRKGKEPYPMVAEVKEDEIRCRVLVNPRTREVEYRSFAEKPLHNLERHDRMWASIAAVSGYREFDTGIIVNNNFNDTYRWTRSSKNVPMELDELEQRFILFDLPESKFPYIQLPDGGMSRTLEMENVLLAWAMGGWGVRVHRPHSVYVQNRTALDKFYVDQREAGYEGVMGKVLHHLYERKRATTWFKVKPTDDADGVIIALHEAISDTDDEEKGLYKGKPLGRIGSVTLRLEDGSTATPHGIKHDLGREMYLDPQKFLYQWAEFEFMERDRQGGYRHPVFKRIREAKA